MARFFRCSQVPCTGQVQVPVEHDTDQPPPEQLFTEQASWGGVHMKIMRATGHTGTDGNAHTTYGTD